MKPQYKGHLIEWRPDYPPAFYVMYKGVAFNTLESASNKQESINAFTIARDAISKAISSPP